MIRDGIGCLHTTRHLRRLQLSLSHAQSSYQFLLRVQLFSGQLAQIFLKILKHILYIYIHHMKMIAKVYLLSFKISYKLFRIMNIVIQIGNLTNKLANLLYEI